MKKRRWPFTKAEVDSLILGPKCISGIPKAERKENYWVMEIPVYLKTDLRRPFPSLVIVARVIHPLSGLPRNLPSVAIELKGHRIRGIDRNIRHDNPDGSRVKGWHEHLWSEEHGDDVVIATKEPKHKDLKGVLKTALKKWDISIREEQGELLK